MATKQKQEIVCAPPARLAAILRSPMASYLGPCVVNAKGGWTRIGPTWRVEGHGWVCWGAGVRVWNTTEGLAQLASDPNTPSPTWHAVGWATAEEPNVVFHMEDGAYKSNAMADIRVMTNSVEAWLA